MNYKLVKKIGYYVCNKKFSNLILLMLNISCLIMMSFCSIDIIHKIHKKSSYRQHPLIRNSVIDTIAYVDSIKPVGFKKQKNNIYKEKNKKLKSYKGYATYYCRGGKKTANGERFQPYSKLTCAASPKFPLGTKLKVTNIANGKNVIVTVTDRGNFYKKSGCEYDLDLTYFSFSKLSEHHHGRLKIEYTIVD